MFKVIIVVGWIYLVASTVSLMVWPMRSVAAFSEAWRKATVAALCCSVAIFVIAALLLLILPARLAWLSLALLVIRHMLFHAFSRAALSYGGKPSRETRTAQR